MNKLTVVMIFCFILTSSQLASANSTNTIEEQSDDTVTLLNEAILVSTFIGGDSDDKVEYIATDCDGNYVLVGETASTDFPIVHPIYETKNDGFDVFVMKVNKTGTEIIFSTYIGGNSFDIPYGCDLDSDGNIYVTGVTGSTDFPTINALNSTSNGDYDAFVFKLTANGSALEYSTYLGGPQQEYGISIAVDESGNAYVGGQTRSAAFPVRNGIDETYSGPADCYLTMINATGNGIIFSTFIGGISTESVESAIELTDDFVYMVGTTFSYDFPTTPDCFQSSFNGESDGFMLRIPRDGSSLNYSSFFGGSDYDDLESLSVDSTGDVIIGGVSRSSDLPMISSYDSIKDEQTDIFIAKLDLKKTGFASLEFSTFYGGNGIDGMTDLFIDSENNIVIGGITFSNNLDLGAGPYDTELNEGIDGIGFVLSISSDGANLLFARYHEGAVFGVCGDALGTIAIVGETLVPDTYLKNAFDDEFGIGSEGFLVICDCSVLTPLTPSITTYTPTIPMPDESIPPIIIAIIYMNAIVAVIFIIGLIIHSRR